MQVSDHCRISIGIAIFPTIVIDDSNHLCLCFRKFSITVVIELGKDVLLKVGIVEVHIIVLHHGRRPV